jgi:hypothetical protein
MAPLWPNRRCTTPLPRPSVEEPNRFPRLGLDGAPNTWASSYDERLLRLGPLSRKISDGAFV